MSKKETLLLQSIRVSFKTTDNKLIPPEQQAEEILGEFREAMKANKSKQMALIFSENCKRLLEISESYLNQNFTTGIKGANQADVVEHMENLTQNVKYSDLQNKIFYLGIPTCYQSGGVGEVPAKFLIFSLAVICCFLGAGEVLVFGWKNQVSGEDYAIGGGISQKLTKDQYNLIQNVLHILEKNPDDLQKIPRCGKTLYTAYQEGQKTGDPLYFTRENIRDLQERKPHGGEVPTLAIEDADTLLPSMPPCTFSRTVPEESEDIFNSGYFENEENQLTPLKNKSKESDSEGELTNKKLDIGGLDPFFVKDSDSPSGKGKEPKLESDHNDTPELSKLASTLPKGPSRKRKTLFSLFGEDDQGKKKEKLDNSQSLSSSSSSSSSSRVFNF